MTSSAREAIWVPERIILPRISDVVASLRELFRKREANSNTGDWEMELISVDLSDACMHFGVHPDEIQNCLAPGLDDDELVLCSRR